MTSLTLEEWGNRLASSNIDDEIIRILCEENEFLKDLKYEMTPEEIAEEAETEFQFLLSGLYE